MWILESLPVPATEHESSPLPNGLAGVPAFWLLTGTHTIGRRAKSGRSADLIICGDNTISKAHAAIVVHALDDQQDVSVQQLIEIQDTASAWGTFLNGVRCGQGREVLHDGDLLRFANKLTYRVRRYPLVLYLANTRCKEEVPEGLATLGRAAGAHIVSSWSDNVTHVLLEEGDDVNASVVLAVLSGVSLVKYSWLHALCATPRWVGTLPPADAHHPQHGHLHLGVSTPLRVTLPPPGQTGAMDLRLLENLHFVFYPAVEEPQLERCVELVGGTLVPSCTPCKELLARPAILVGMAGVEKLPGGYQGLPLVTQQNLLACIMTGNTKVVCEALKTFSSKGKATPAAKKAAAAAAATLNSTARATLPQHIPLIADEISDDTTQEEEVVEDADTGAEVVTQAPGANAAAMQAAAKRGGCARTRQSAAAAHAAATPQVPEATAEADVPGKERTKQTKRKIARTPPPSLIGNLLRSMMANDSDSEPEPKISVVLKEGEEESDVEEPMGGSSALQPVPGVARQAPVHPDATAARPSVSMVPPAGSKRALVAAPSSSKQARRGVHAPTPPAAVSHGCGTPAPVVRLDLPPQPPQQPLCQAPAPVPPLACSNVAAVPLSELLTQEIIQDEATGSEFLICDLIRPCCMLQPPQHTALSGAVNYKTFRKAQVAGGNSTQGSLRVMTTEAAELGPDADIFLREEKDRLRDKQLAEDMWNIPKAHTKPMTSRRR